MVYAPYAQWPIGRITLVIQTDGSDGIQDFQAVTAELTPDVAWEAISLERLLARHGASEWFFLWVFVGFAGATGLLCVLGVYFVVERYVRLRRREWAIRMALGADARRLKAGVLRQSGMLFLFGAGGGVLASLAVNKGLSGLLYDVATVQQVGISIGGAIVVLAVAFMTSFIAMRTGLALEPAAVLKEG